MPSSLRGDRVAYVTVVLVYLLLRTAAIAGTHPTRFLDSASYLEVAGEPLLSQGFFAGIRPWAAPLLYKVLPTGDGYIVAGQLCVSLVCWLALAVAAAACVRPGAFRLVTFAAVLGFSTCMAITRWDTFVLTESLSVSLTAALLAAWLSYVRHPRPGAIVAVLATTCLWVFVRDTHVLLVFLTAVMVAASVARPGPRLGRVVLLSGLVAIVGVSYASTNSDAASLRRRQRVLLHVVGQRVLPDAEATAWFRAHGMPEPSPRVRANSERLAALGFGIPSDAESDVFLDWVADHGRVALAGYLLTHPVYAVEPLLTEHYELVGAHPGYRVDGLRAVLPAAELAYVRPSAAVFPVLGLVVIGAAATARRAGAARWWIVPVAGLVMQIPHAIVVWHGDTMDVGRHALVIGLSLRLCALLLALFAISALLDRRASSVAEPLSPQARHVPSDPH